MGLLVSVSAQAARPISAKPASNPGEWITAYDYPSAALKAKKSGKTGFLLAVDPTGHVTACTVTQPSGTAALDETTCALLTTRAQFVPARDRNGVAIASTFASAVSWRLPAGSDVPSASMTSCAPDTSGDIKIVTPAGCV